MASDILIVDDELDIRELMAGILGDEGYETRLAGNSDDTLRAIQARVPSMVLLDVWLQGSRMDGLELLDAIKEKHPDLPVVVISGHGNVETAVTAIKKGAYDYIEKPFKAERLVLIVRRAIEASKLRRENEQLRQRSGDETELVGVSGCINQLRQMVDRVAPTGSRVLITGPSGCGKEVVARMLHARSTRARNSFVVINAASMAPDRVEEELFGIEAADGRPAKVGVFEQAHKGTLFLDEVADMPLETQGKILRVLVDQTFVRVGGGPKVQVDVRVVSSSSRDLTGEIEAGRFREDLYHRLNVVPIAVPALADRREDIPVLAEHFMDRIATATGLTVRKIGEDALAALQAHDWPGNVRQLRNNIERLLILASGEKEGAITADMLPSEVARTTPQVGEGEAGQNIMALPLREARESFERQYLMAQIRRFGGNISRTASFIGMERSALHRKLKSLGVSTSNRSELSA